MRKAVGTLAVVDFGGQFTHLITRTIRELGFRADLRTPEELARGALDGCAGLVLSGGPDSVVGASIEGISARIRAFPRPILGICFGHQLLAVVYGGRVESAKRREFGLATLSTEGSGSLFVGLPPRQTVWMSHGDHVEVLPPGFRVTASTEGVAIAAFESENGLRHGVQFHPEVVHTEHGRALLQRFVELCGRYVEGGLQRLGWSPEEVRDRILEAIRTDAAGRTLVLLVSGGVDSLVALALCKEAVGEHRVHAVHIDTGFMRKGESAEIVRRLLAVGLGHVRAVDASARFFSALGPVIDPEEKRATIGRLFVEVFQETLPRLGVGEDWVLVQGTIYPDRIETGGSRRADRIKTHHNRVDEVLSLMAQGRVIEPLADLYKHEVRRLGALLGLPSDLLHRQPFPGPGLAVRIICSSGVTPTGFDRDESALVSMTRRLGYGARVLPLRSVGVQGDARTYRHPAVIWPLNDAPLSWGELKVLASQIVNELPSVNRVVLALRAPEGSLVLGRCGLTRELVALLQEVDWVARDATEGMADIWQMPVVALPLFDPAGNQAFVLRPVTSRDAMTADVFEMEESCLRSLVARLEALEGVAAAFYDLTTKPPGTIEWE